MALRLEPELRERLGRLAKAHPRRRSSIAVRAIREYVDVNEWQMAEIPRALEEADRREFASPEEVNWVLTKHRGRKRARLAR